MDWMSEEDWKIESILIFSLLFLSARGLLAVADCLPFSISDILFSSEAIGKIDYPLNQLNRLNLETNAEHQVH